MEGRIDHLDAIMAELAHAQTRAEIELKQMRRESIALDKRLAEQGKRMDANIGEMKEDTRRMKEDTRLLKEDTRRMIEDTRRMKKAWGDLANKMGTVAEDVVAPNIPRLAVEEFGMSEVEDLLPRARRTSRRGDKRRTEYDIVCAGPEKVIVVEVKCTPTLEKINEVPARIAAFFDFFPEYEGRELIGVFASWSIDADLLPAISQAGLYGIAMGEDNMDVVARPAAG